MTIHARLITLAIAGLCASGAVGCEKSGVQAARQNTSDPTSKQILSMDDRDFLIGAEKAGIRQRTLAQQALQKSNNNEVREFARHVITDRSQALSELKRVMDAKQMKEQAALAVEVQMTAEARLQGLSNAAFDHELLRQYAQTRLSASFVVMLLVVAAGLFSSIWVKPIAASPRNDRWDGCRDSRGEST